MPALRVTPIALAASQQARSRPSTPRRRTFMMHTSGDGAIAVGGAMRMATPRWQSHSLSTGPLVCLRTARRTLNAADSLLDSCCHSRRRGRVQTPERDLSAAWRTGYWRISGCAAHMAAEGVAEDRVAFANRMRLLVRLQSLLPLACASLVTPPLACACAAEPEGQRQPGRVAAAGVLQAKEGTLAGESKRQASPAGARLLAERHAQAPLLPPRLCSS